MMTGQRFQLRRISRRMLLASLAGVMSGALLAACGSDSSETTSSASDSSARATPFDNGANAGGSGDVGGPDSHFPEIQTADDGTRHLIPLDEVRSGGPPKDGIPSLDSPQFVGPEGWKDQRYDDSGLVIGVEVGGVWRGYPFQVLVWHEIANDTFGNRPLCITYCPLCGSAIAFIRTIVGEPVEFGVSGKLYNSDLLMYDRQTDTLWSQLTGTAVVGELAGQRLEIYPSQLLSWLDWKAAHPEGQILKRPTEFKRDYDSSPYGDYASSPGIWFPVTATDDRLFPKTRVTGIELDTKTFGAYPDEQVQTHGPVNDVLGDKPILVAADPDAGGNIVAFERIVNNRVLAFGQEGNRLVDQQTGSKWSFAGEAVSGELSGTQLAMLEPIKTFWFAWYAFHQETALWQGN